MKNQITSRDYELISAYLDNQLSAKERAYLEARLKAVPELRKEMHEISKTRLMLRAMPKMRAPHNYFINPKVAVVPARARFPSRWAPGMGIVSAVATILFVLVIFGENLLTTTAPVALAPMPAVATNDSFAQPEAQRNAITSPQPTEEAPVIMMQAPSNAAPTESETVTESIIQGSVTPTTIYLNAYPPSGTPVNKISEFGITTPTPTPTCSMPECVTPPGFGAGDIQVILTTTSPTPTSTTTSTPTSTTTNTPTPTPTQTSTPTPTDTAQPGAGLGTSADTGMTSKEPTGIESSTGISAPSVAQTEESQPNQNIDFIRYLLLAVKISLAGVAIIAGLAAIILRLRPG